MTLAARFSWQNTIFVACLVVAYFVCSNTTFAASAFYTFTSGPGGDGFVWDVNEPPAGPNDLPDGDTFSAPGDNLDDFIDFENFSGNVTFFDNNYQAAGNSTLISNEAWWGNPTDGSGIVGVAFGNTNSGAANSVAFDFAWALAGEDAFDEIEIEVYDADFDSAFLSRSLDSSFNAGPVFGGFNGWEGSIAFDLADAQADNLDVDAIAGFFIDLSSIADFGVTGEFAIDNLSIDGGGGGGPQNSNVFPASTNGGPIGGISTNRLKNSFDAQVSFDVKNDGAGGTTFTATLDATSDSEFVVDSPATNQPIAGGAIEPTGVIAKLSSTNLSGVYESSVTIANDLNANDLDESIPYTVTIYDPPDLSDNSSATVQVDVSGAVLLANAPEGPHAGARRAGAEVTAVTVTGPFSATGFAVDDFVGPGVTQNGTTSFDRYGRLNGAHNGTLTVDLKMNSAAGSFLNGAQPVPSVIWNLQFDLATIANDSVAVAATESFGPSKVGVNNIATAATVVDGESTKAQTVSMALVGDPEQSDSTKSAELATNVVDLDFSVGADLYVLQFTYLDANVPSGFTEEQMQLLVFDTGSDDWMLATDANSPSSSTFFSGSYADYLAGPGGGTLDAGDLSAFGVDATSNHAWAVLDHASLFSLGVLGTFTLSADTEPDGDVDGADFLALQRSNPVFISQWELEYGSGLGPLASSQTVPEPTGFVLALCSSAMILGRQRRT